VEKPDEPTALEPGAPSSPRRRGGCLGCLFPLVLVALIGGGVLWLTVPMLRDPEVLLSLYFGEAPAHLPVPVAGVTPGQLADTWGGPRSGGRRHEGIDIFAPLGTPVLSSTVGVVSKVGENQLGGQVVRVLGPGREWHYYAHLDRFGRFQPGDVVLVGDTLGYVGTTGNAVGTPPHLHYGIYNMPWEPENPYPRLVP